MKNIFCLSMLVMAFSLNASAESFRQMVFKMGSEDAELVTDDSPVTLLESTNPDNQVFKNPRVRINEQDYLIGGDNAEAFNRLLCDLTNKQGRRLYYSNTLTHKATGNASDLALDSSSGEIAHHKDSSATFVTSFVCMEIPY